MNWILEKVLFYFNTSIKKDKYEIKINYKPGNSKLS